MFEVIQNVWHIKERCSKMANSCVAQAPNIFIRHRSVGFNEL